LGELLKNLIDNALAYAGRGAVVTVRSQILQNGAVILEVEDNGPGLDTERAAALIQDRGKSLRLRMSASTAPETGQGYGLGLTITAEIAALFGADLSLHPMAQGRGLRASVQLAPPAQGLRQ